MQTEALTFEQLQKAKDLFAAASDDPDGAVALAETLGSDDPQIKAWLERMLRADKASHPILDRPLALTAGLNGEELTPGDVVGSYTIVRQIGAGGMGTVYQAERSGLAAQQFALKAIRWSSPEFLRRFEREEAILTSVHHPNVARLVDAGVSKEKRPYLVMEFVEGEPITAFCERHDLAVNERIRLFRQLCSALRYLHQNLIVHRDLKPSNVLVTLDGAVKLVDFGIAKLLQPQGLQSALDTTLVLMTPDYASPEQVRSLPATTLTDVYGAGTLLFELLGGTNPFARKNGELHETLRAICEQPPEKPSVVVLRSERTGVRQVSRQLRGELDNIVLKAIRKEPERRYASIEQLDDDLDRYLTNQPVMAQGDSLSYRLRKFVRRERAIVSFAAILLMVLLGGFLATSLEARIARRERARAEAHAAAAEEAKAIAENQTRIAEEERQRAELASLEATQQKSTSERRLAELEHAAQGAAQLYQEHQTSRSPDSALIAENTRDVLLTLQREHPLDPALARLLGTMPTPRNLPPDRAWHVPSGWSVGQSNDGEYVAGTDHKIVHRGRSSLFVRAQKSHPAGVVTVSQSFAAANVQGARVRLKGYLRLDDKTDQAFLYLVAKNEDGELVAFDATGASVIGTWGPCEIVIDIPEESDSISIGVQFHGSAALRVDDISFQRVDSSVPLTRISGPANLDFKK